ncbi:MAG: hypothetical protein MJZ30_11660 [Paludibacteraceae bacterium]|nr:hypothetical protein [Paludibacteraceae bacterium]
MLQFNNTELSISSAQQEFLDELNSLLEKVSDAASCPFELLNHKDKYKSEIDKLASVAESMREKEPLYPGIKEVNLPRAFDSVVANLDDAARTLNELDYLNYEDLVPFVKRNIESAYTVIESELDELLHRQSQLIDDIESEK